MSAWREPEIRRALKITAEGAAHSEDEPRGASFTSFLETLRYWGPKVELTPENRKRLDEIEKEAQALAAQTASFAKQIQGSWVVPMLPETREAIASLQRLIPEANLLMRKSSNQK